MSQRGSGPLHGEISRTLMVVNVTATWSVANAANQVRLDVLRVEIW